MRVLVATNMYPTSRNLTSGVFVEQQVRSLRELGVEVQVLHFDRMSGGRNVYWSVRRRIRRELRRFHPELVHVHYGGLMADLLTSAVRDRPVIVQYWGSDLLGSHTERGLRRLSVQAGVLASRRAAGRAAAVIVVSEGLRAALPLRAAAGNVWVVPGGIDLERFRPLDQHDCQLNIGWDEGRKHVLFPSSSQRPEKRYALAQAAVERLRGEFQADLHELDGVPTRT